MTPAAGVGTAFTDSDGVPANARLVPVTVPGGTDQLQAAVAWDPRSHTAPVAVSVFDPAGRLAGYSLPLGNGGTGGRRWPGRSRAAGPWPSGPATTGRRRWARCGTTSQCCG
ncbi:hypothetical protein NKG94_15650 [Micromonospora sp. M12]